MNPILLLAVSDDNSSYLLRRYAEQCGLTILRAHSLAHTVTLAREFHPAVIILDYGATGMQGGKLLHHLKSNAETQDIPVVLYAWLVEANQRAADRVDGILHHPILYDDFHLTMERLGVLTRE